MNTERESSIEELEARRSKVESSLSWRRNLLERIGQGEIREEDSFDTTVRIGRIRKRFSNSFIPRAEGRLENLGHEIESLKLKSQESLLQNAQEYLDEVSIRREQLRQIRDYTNEGFIRPEILEKRELEFKDLTSKPEREPQLRDAIQLLRSRQEQSKIHRETKVPKEAKEELTRVIIDPEKKIVDIEGKRFKFSAKYSFEVLLYLAKHANREIRSSQINKLLRGLNSNQDAGQALRTVQDFFGRAGQESIIKKVRRGKVTHYKLLANVEFVGKELTGKFSVPLPDGLVFETGSPKMASLAKNLEFGKENAKTVAVLAEAVYGVSSPKTKSRIFSWVFQMKPFLSALNWQISKTKVEGRRAFFLEKGDVAQKEEPEEETKSEEEKHEESEAFFQSRLDTLNFMVENPDAKPHQILQKLGLTRDGQPFNRGNGPHAIRHAVQRLARRVIASEANDQELQTFENISRFMSQRGLADLNEFLAWNYAKFRISPRPLDIGEFRTKTVETTPEILETAIGAESLVEEEVIREEAPIIPSFETEPEIEPEPEIASITVSTSTIETRPPKPMLRDLEKRNPDTRQRINLLMEEIKEKHVPLPATSAQLGSCFRIRPKQIEMWVREGWLRPIAKRQGRDAFHLEEVIAILFFRKNGTNFNKKLVGELHEIIRDEINKRNSPRS